jgi:hypothetical protein
VDPGSGATASVDPGTLGLEADTAVLLNVGSLHLGLNMSTRLLWDGSCLKLSYRRHGPPLMIGGAGGIQDACTTCMDRAPRSTC